MDQGHRETETLIKALEQKVNREYSQATQELTAKLEDYFRRFEVKDEKWRIMVQNGERTVEEYQKWRFGQMMVGERWENMRDSIAEDLHNQNLISRGMLTGRMPDAYALNHNWSTYDIEKAGRVNTGYTLYNRDAVERLLRDDPDLLKPPGVQMQKTFADWDAYINKDLGNIEDQIADIRKAYPTNMPPAMQSQLNRLEKEKRSFDKLMADGKDIRWQKGQIQSVTLQAILQGESIPNMAKRIANTMGEMNRKASIRYARTAMTSAQNGGRKDAYQRAKGLGINLQQEWIATLDFRTRHAHRQLDGQIRDIDEPFQVDGYDIEYPGDPAAPGYLVYNCRCTTAAKVEGWDSMSGQLRSDEDIEGMSYEEWKEGHSQPQDILSQTQTGEAFRNQTIQAYYSENRTENRVRRPRRDRPDFDSMDKQQLVDYAQTNLKTEFIDTKGANEAFVRDAVKVASEFENRCGAIDGLSIRFGGTPSGTYAKYDDATKTLLLKKTGSIQQFENSLREDNVRYHIRWKTDLDYHATETFSGTIWHELGHALDIEYNQGLSRYLSSNSALDVASVRVSAYARTTQNIRATKRSEAWAENFAAYMDGGKNKAKVPTEISDYMEEIFRRRKRG